MTEPKRWSSPGSDVDPVLRSVLIYARDQQPSSRQVQAIVRGAGRGPARRRHLGWLTAVAAGTILGGAGAALAGYANGLFDAAPAIPSAAALRVPRPERAAASSLSSPRPAAAASASAEASTTLRVPPAAPRYEPSARAEQDSALLHEARRIMTTAPAQALTLTRDHELHFPASALVEERQALRVEALARLGRDAEAAHELSSFDQRYPRSIYRRRLRALIAE